MPNYRPLSLSWKCQILFKCIGAGEKQSSDPVSKLVGLLK